MFETNELQARANRTYGSNTSINLESGDYAVIGFSDHEFKGRNGETVKTYVLVLAMLDIEGKVVNLTTANFSDFYRRPNGFTSFENGKIVFVNHSGKLVDYCTKTLIAHKDESIEKVFAVDLLPTLHCVPLRITAKPYLARSRRGNEYTAAIYTIDKLDGRSKLTLDKTALQTLAKAAGINDIYGIDGTISYKTAEPASATTETSDVPF